MKRRAFVHGTAAWVAALGLAPGVAIAKPRTRVAGGRTSGAFAWPAVTAETRPWTRWWWLGSAVDEEGLRDHLRAYRDAGIGGVEIQPIYGAKGYEDRNRQYLGREWVEALDTATRLARRLGLGIDMTTGSGWPFGGPWVKAEDSAARLVTKQWKLSGGERLAEPVRAKQPVKPPLTPSEIAEEFSGGKNPQVPLPEPSLTALVARDERGATVDLTRLVGADRRLDWTAPAGRWTLVGAFCGRVEKYVERAGPGAEGLVIDYVSERGLPGYLQRFDQALGKGSHGLRAMFHDSYELENADWSEAILADFARLRGYDPLPHLPEIATDAGHADVRARVRSDFRETFSDLLLERFTERWSAWNAQHGWITRNQAHGSPANLLDLYGAVDIPETETFGSSGFPIPGLRVDAKYSAAKSGRPDPLVMRFAASPAHVTGKRLVSSESVTWLAEHFHVSLSQMKPELDQLFASGINHVFFHGATYSPKSAGWPGFVFYASTDLDRSNTLWRDLPDLTRYVTHCQSVLQHGQHDNDVLVYFPQHDLWHDSKGELTPDFTVHGEEWVRGHPSGFGRVAGGLLDRGWQFDYVSDRQLTGFRRDGDGIRNEHGAYATVLVPGAERMPLATLEHLSGLAEAGATVVFAGRLPKDVPGLGDLAARRVRFQALLDGFRKRPVAGRPGSFHVGRGTVVVTSGGAAGLDRALERTGARREPLAEAGLRVLRRTHAEGHHYFLVNLGAKTVSGWLPLGVAARSVVGLDPLREANGVVEQRRRNGRTEVRLSLASGESLILRTFARRAVGGPRWAGLDAGGPSVALDGPWDVEFVAGGPRRPARRTLRRLTSWTTLGRAASVFAGTARYATTFTVPADADGGDWLLDLGDVRESARVTLNGTDLGTAWSLPFRIPVGDALRPGSNRLELEVTNLAANRVRDLTRRSRRWIRFFIVSITYGTFDPAKWETVESGLLGPVRLVRRPR